MFLSNSNSPKRTTNRSTVNPTVRLKVPSKALAKAVACKKKTILIYYYTAKSFNAHGTFLRGELVSYLMQQTGKAKATVKKNIGKLIKAGWLRKEAGKCQLCTYDKVWSDLGIDLTEEHLSILYFETGDNIDLRMGLEEFKLSTRKQEKAITKTVMCRLFNISHTGLSDEAAGKLRLMRREAVKPANIHKVKVREYNDICALEKLTAETDNAITCKTFANLFGRTSDYTGWKMQKKLKKAGLIAIENRRFKVKCATKQEFRLCELPSSFSWFKGVIRKQLPNKITVL